MFFQIKKPAKKQKMPVDPEKLKWIKTLLERDNEQYKPEEYLDKIKMDFFKNRIFVFTPKADVIDLPEGSIPIDFAYHIHTYIGDHAGGTKINGKMATLLAELKSGDMVEILVDKKRAKPSEEWLNKVQTNLARDKIKQSLKKSGSFGKFFQIFNR